jgi:anti-sigma regulatory factor (Ser/Thr protein kinase)
MTGGVPASDISVRVAEATDVAEARRGAIRLAGTAGLDDDAKARLSLVVTEAGTNLLRHAGGGELLVGAALAPAEPAVDVLALDTGPGLNEAERSFADGYSTVGGAGTGLGAVRRLADLVDVQTGPGQGLALLARVSARASNVPGPAPRLRAGVVSAAVAGETRNGDTWGIEDFDSLVQVLLVDGLGHGAGAAEAADRAREVVHEGGAAPLNDLVRAAHAALRHTRGAALGLARLDFEAASLTYCGVGNISGRIVGLESSHNLVSHHGIVGHAMGAVQEFVYPWPGPRSLLVMHSDGLSARWRTSDYPAANRIEPKLLAGLLYRDAGRRRDDATVVVLRDERRP